MKRLVFILALLCPAGFGQILGPILFGAAAANAGCGTATGYTNTFTVTIATQAGQAGDLTSYPLIFGGDSHLATVANGGLSQSTGTDVVFCTKNDGTGTILPYMLTPQTYGATTGLAKWIVQAPSISHTTTTTLYGYVGKASAVDKSCGPSGANNCGSTLWSGYLGVLEFGSSTVIDFTDWTLINAYTNTSVNAVSGKIFGGGNFGLSARINANGLLNPGGSGFTSEAWISASSPSGGPDMITANSIANTSGFAFYELSTGLSVSLEGSGSESVARFTGEANLANGAFHHVVGIWNGGNATLAASYKFYVDGVSHSFSIVATGTASYVTATSNLRYGLDPGGANAFGGAISEARIKNGVLTADQILWDFNNSSSPSSTYTVSLP